MTKKLTSSCLFLDSSNLFQKRLERRLICNGNEIRDMKVFSTISALDV